MKKNISILMELYIIQFILLRCIVKKLDEICDVLIWNFMKEMHMR